MSLKQVKALNLNSSPKEQPVQLADPLNCYYDEILECPICRHALLPTVLSAYYSLHYSARNVPDRLFIVCYCQKCGGVFVCEYRTNDQLADFADTEFRQLVSVAPLKPPAKHMFGEINAISPDFVETYYQAEIAEKSQLLKICGVGYRKALEYLVKDYLCYIFPSEADEIQSEFLGKAIRRIDNEKIRLLAERSAWIGNDETHYIRKHEDVGIDEMKRFIRAMLTYIESELAFEAAARILSK